MVLVVACHELGRVRKQDSWWSCWGKPNYPWKLRENLLCQVRNTLCSGPAQSLSLWKVNCNLIIWHIHDKLLGNNVVTLRRLILSLSWLFYTAVVSGTPRPPTLTLQRHTLVAGQGVPACSWPRGRGRQHVTTQAWALPSWRQNSRTLLGVLLSAKQNLVKKNHPIIFTLIYT